ncbi:hypothetical protein ACXWR7_13290, partial [Streptococcus pyogenes]
LKDTPSPSSLSPAPPPSPFSPLSFFLASFFLPPSSFPFPPLSSSPFLPSFSPSPFPLPPPFFLLPSPLLPLPFLFFL